MAGGCSHNRRHDCLAIALLAALAVAFWGNCLFGGKVPVAALYQKQMLPWSAVAEASTERRQWDSLLWDSMAQFYPWRLLLHRAAQTDQLPLWNPYQFCGYPFVGNGQSAMFYPLNWLYFVVHPKVGLGLSAALHFFLGGLFVFGLARAWKLSVLPALFAALAFSYGGFMVTWIELPTLPNSLVWLPLAWWGIELSVRGGAVPLSGAQPYRARERGRGEEPFARGPLMLAVALGMSLLAGHFQIAAYVWIFAFVYAVVRLVPRARIAPRCALACCLGLMLAMAQVLPTLELAHYSSRGSGGPSAAGFEFHRQRALQPLELATLLTPDFLGSPVTNDYPGISYSEHCGFVGAITLLLGIAGLILKPRRATAWLFGGIALFALWGAMAGPPAMLLYWGVPKLGQAGGFARLLSVWTLAAAMWGAVGLQSIIEAWGLRPSVLRTHAEEEEGAAADRGLKPPAEGPPADRPADGRLGTAVGCIAIALLLGQVLPWAYRFNPRAKAEDVYPETELIRQLRARIGEGRYLAANDRGNWRLDEVPANVILPPNAAMVYGLRCVDGYDSLFPASYRLLTTAIEQADPSPITNGNMLLTSDRPAWPANCLVTARDAPLLVPTWWRSAWSGDGCSLYSSPLRGPERVAVRRPRTLRKRTLDVWAYPPRTVDQDNAVFMTFRAPGTQASLAVLDSYHPGWRADDGTKQKEIRPLVSPAHFRCVALTGQETQIRMIYLPASVACGLFVSLLALAIIAGVAVFARGGRGR